MVDPSRYFSFQPVYAFLVCEMVHIKQPLLLIGKNSPCIGSSGFHLIMLNASLNKSFLTFLLMVISG